MWDTVKELLTSKKAIAAIVGVITALFAKRGLELPEEAVTEIVQVIMVYILAQGVADHGKEKEKTTYKFNLEQKNDTQTKG